MFSIVAESRWRQQRLLILCYHGISLDREHEWRRPLFMTPFEFRGRLEVLRRGRFPVLPLDEAVQLLYGGNLPERSVAITFDDGYYDFYSQAYPLLREYDFPATVYLTTYYADREVPIFPLICSYMLWKRRGSVVDAQALLGEDAKLDLRNAASREDATKMVIGFAERNGMTVGEKNEFARSLAVLLGEDPAALWNRRVLQLMNAREVTELAEAGVQFQLHTHRHRSPNDETLYRQELRENRMSIEAMTGVTPTHFCYPSGVYREEFLPWLAKEQVSTATTCNPGLATRHSNRLLLPRLVDHAGLSSVEFEGWLAGISSFLPQRAHQREWIA